jgi:hypothetical protein
MDIDGKLAANPTTGNFVTSRIAPVRWVFIC